MKKKSEQGIAFIWIIIAGALLIVGVGVFASKKKDQEIKEFQAELSPIQHPSLLPTPSPTLTPEQVSKKQEELNQQLDKLTEQFSDWKKGSVEQKQIERDIQEMIDKQMSASDQNLLKILPPKERAELENAIRETQQVLQNIEVFDYTPPSIGDITKGLDQINKQTQEQIQKNIEKQQQEFQPIDPKKIEEYFNQNPPAVSQEGKEFSPEAQEYYYRKHILKDPAFQY
ncbi:hypothetical protein ISS85_02015 [Candidatus Microgenomates bacterium]|nr:hypothetical protein [Candidatus Microgenomates bacterium]